jgi:hypothetical protein
MKTKRSSRLVVFIAISCFIINSSCKEFGTHKGPYDFVDKENNKIGILFDRAVADEKARIERNWYPGLMPTSTKRIDEYFKTIKFIETYASKGTESSNKFNQVELKITFNDNRIVSGLYTGVRVVQAFGMGAQLLIKMELANGKVIKAYTNGAEKDKGPENVTSDIEKIREKVFYYDYKANSSAYYYPTKTNNEIQKEWDEIK